jgi:hypothetical protein
MPRCGCTANWRVEEEPKHREKTTRRSRGGEAYIYIYSPEMEREWSWNNEGSGEVLDLSVRGGEAPQPKPSELRWDCKWD